MKPGPSFEKNFDNLDFFLLLVFDLWLEFWLFNLLLFILFTT